MQSEVAIDEGLLFQTVNTSIYQKDSSETFLFHFYDEEIEFRFCEFISFRKKIQKIDVIALLTNDEPDVEIIRLVHCDRLIVLPVVQILELQEVLDGAFAMMELNRVIHKAIIRKIV